MSQTHAAAFLILSEVMSSPLTRMRAAADIQLKGRETFCYEQLTYN